MDKPTQDKDAYDELLQQVYTAGYKAGLAAAAKLVRSYMSLTSTSAYLVENEMRLERLAKDIEALK